MKSIYKLHVGIEDGVDKYKVYAFNPCSIENVNKDYVKEAVVMLQYILDAETLKGNTDDKLPYTMALIEMKKVYEILKISRTTLNIDTMIKDFSSALAELMAVMEQNDRPDYDKWYSEVLKKIKENNECY